MHVVVKSSYQSLFIIGAGGYRYRDTPHAGDNERFRLNISFPLELIAAFFFSLLALLYTIHKRLQVSMYSILTFPAAVTDSATLMYEGNRYMLC